jgi:hypothetical protein
VWSGDLDRTVVQHWIALGPAMRRQQAVLTHQAQHPSWGDANAVQDAQSRPDLEVALASEGRGVLVGTNGD